MRCSIIRCLVGLTLAAAAAHATGRRVTCYTAENGNLIPFLGSILNGIRFQTLVDKEQINYAGALNDVEFFNYFGYAGRYDSYRLYLCHTAKTSLSPTFAENYVGTPVLVGNWRSFPIPAARDWFSLRMMQTYDYNNVDGLLVEVRWLGDDLGDVPVYVGRPQGSDNHRVWAANDPEAESGSADAYPYYCRLSFGAYGGVATTSLGRVRALYR
jgi:hypothetical protein